MSMLLSEAVAAVRSYVDDSATQGTPRWSDADVKRPMKSAQAEVMQLVLQSGSRTFLETGSVTTDPTGLASLTTLAPLQIVDVAIVQSNQRTILKRREPRNASQVAATPQPLQIIFVPRAVFPADDATAFSWNAVDSPMLDELLVLTAAGAIKATIGEINPVIEMRKAEVRKAIMDGFNASSWRPIVGGTNSYSRQLYWYMPNPDQLQLLYA